SARPSRSGARIASLVAGESRAEGRRRTARRDVTDLRPRAPNARLRHRARPAHAVSSPTDEAPRRSRRAGSVPSRGRSGQVTRKHYDELTPAARKRLAVASL